MIEPVDVQICYDAITSASFGKLTMNNRSLAVSISIKSTLITTVASSCYHTLSIVCQLQVCKLSSNTHFVKNMVLRMSVRKTAS